MFLEEVVSNALAENSEIECKSKIIFWMGRM